MLGTLFTNALIVFLFVMCVIIIYGTTLSLIELFILIYKYTWKSMMNKNKI